jgi:hypothetical protein
MKLFWKIDKKTENIAENIDISFLSKVDQYDGSDSFGRLEIWEKYILKQDKFPEFCFSKGGKLIPSPDNIINCFRRGLYLQALALTVLWGSMSRRVKFIYTKSLRDINTLFNEIILETQKTKNVEKP